MKSEGNVYHIGETEVVSDKFSKRDFVIEVADENPQTGEMYTHLEAFQLTNKNTGIADQLKIGDEVAVYFGIRSNETNKEGVRKFFTNMTAGRIEMIKSVQQVQGAQVNMQPTPQPQQNNFTGNTPNQPDDLPF